MFETRVRLDISGRRNSKEHLGQSPLSKEREPIGGCLKPEFDWIFHVGVTRKNTSVSPLSLWERARVRASGSHSFTQQTQIPYKMPSSLRLNSPRCEAI
jgi:hypothetical protein